MKNFYLTLLNCFLVIFLQAQVSRTLEVSPGQLDSLLAPSELLAITDLTLSGTIDARDIRTMRISMPSLAVVDMSAVSIAAYRDELYDVLYPANMIPQSMPDFSSQYDYSFAGKTSLSSVVLPSTLTGIGSKAFSGCTGLTVVEFPPSLTTIEQAAFMGCTALRSVTLPPALRVLAWEVFNSCSSLVSVDMPMGVMVIGRSAFGGCTSLKSIVLPSSVTEINEYAFYDCSSLENIELSSSLLTIGSTSFAGCRSLTSLVVPSSVKTIEGGVFLGCSNLSKVILPRTLQRIGPGAFTECYNLTSLYVYHTTPLKFSFFTPDVFANVVKENCTLYVPASTKELYASALQWKDFQHIEEMPPFTLAVSEIVLLPDQRTASFDMTAGGAWTATTDASWLSVSPLSGIQSGTLTLTAENNTTTVSRTAIVRVSIADSLFQDIRVTQKGKPVAVHLAQAGTLPALMQGIDVSAISEIVITGEMDVRDFKYIRDQMLMLETMDTRAATIKAYSGKEGTFTFLEEYDYPENEIPPFALVDVYHDIRRKLITVYLPESATSLNREALSYSKTLQEVVLPPSLNNLDFRAIGYCPDLTTVTIPSTTTLLGPQTFAGCISLTSIDLPDAITEMGMQAFEDCTSLFSIKLPPSITSIRKKTFYNCFDLTIVSFNAALTVIEDEAFFNCFSLEAVVLPPGIKTIGKAAFAFCEAMTTLSIPASTESIGNNAFSYCKRLQSIYSYASEPPSLKGTSQVFMGVDQENCTLYVPAGSRSRYASAFGWDQFKNIVEMDELILSAKTAVLEAAEGSEARIAVWNDTACSISYEQSWLTVTTAIEPAQQTLTFTAQANTTDKERSALVTVTAPGFTPMTITVSQRSMTVGTADEMPVRAQVQYYPNPFTEQMTIAIANPSLKEVSVEIFSISRQKIRSLLKAQKGQKISCSWDGRDEQGMEVPQGMYLVKVNEEVRKVVKK